MYISNIEKINSKLDYSKYIIHLKVISKSALLNKGDLQYFYIGLIDAYDNETRMVFFNNEASKYYKEIKTNKCYFINKFVVQPPNRKYKRFKINLKATRYTIIKKATKIPSLINKNNTIYVNDMSNKYKQTCIRNWFKKQK